MIRGIRLKSRRRSHLDICKEADTHLKSFDIEGYHRLTSGSINTSINKHVVLKCYLHYKTITINWYQTWSIDRYKGNYFSEIFWTIWGTGAKFEALFNLGTHSNYSITNYVKFMVFHFWKKWMRELKIININY